MRKRKVTITVLGVIGIFIIAALLIVPATQAKAETVRYKYTTQLTKSEYVLLPDVKGHVVGLLERRGVAIFENEVAALKLQLRFDYIKKQGPWDGYMQITFKDGSTFTQKFKGASSFAPDGEKLLKAKGEYIKGTGRFEGIKGEFSLTGREITPNTKDKTKGDNWVEVTGTYALPKK